MDIAIIILAALTVFSSLGVVMCAKPLNSALSLVLTLFFVAAHYAMMGAHFVAAIQVLVYAGAIMVLVIFVIMLLGIKDEAPVRVFSPRTLFAVFLCGSLGGILTVSFNCGLLDPMFTGPDVKLVEELGNSKAVGQVLYTRFIFPFEITGMLLLAAIVGAVLLAHETRQPLKEGRGLQAMQSAKRKGSEE